MHQFELNMLWGLQGFYDSRIWGCGWRKLLYILVQLTDTDAFAKIGLFLFGNRQKLLIRITELFTIFLRICDREHSLFLPILLLYKSDSLSLLSEKISNCWFRVDKCWYIWSFHQRYLIYLLISIKNWRGPVWYHFTKVLACVHGLHVNRGVVPQLH